MAHISIDRKIFNHPLWKEKRPRTKFEAWLDLIQLVSFKESNKAIINNTVIRWNRGQYPISYSFLSKRWSWSVKRVRIYLQLLKDEKQIETKSIGKITILCLVNYELYNNRIECGGARGTAQKGAQSGAQSGAQINNSITGNYSNEGQDEGQAEGQAKGKLRAGIKEGKEGKEGIIKKPELKNSGGYKDYVDRIIVEFGEAYKKQFNLDYVIVAPGKERSAAGKMAKLYAAKYPECNTEEAIKGIRSYFNQVVGINDPWFKNNITLPTLMFKFNEVNRILRNGKSTGKIQGATDIEVATVLLENFG